MEARRLRRRLYRRWKAEMCGGDARGLDSLGMYSSRRWEWQPLNPALGASRGDVRMALTGQAHVLRYDELRERHRLCTPPSVTQLVSRTSNTYIGKRSTVVRSQLFKERVLSPLPQSVSRKSAKFSTSKLPYATQLNIAQWNVENIKQATLQQQIVTQMREHNWHIMFLSETCLTTCTHYNIDGYSFYFSSDPKHPEAGVGVAISPMLRPFILQFRAHSSRICEVEIALMGSQLRIFGLYAPTQAQGQEYDTARTAFWRKVGELIRPIPAASAYLLVGDLNTRLQGRLGGEGEVLGPHVFGLGYRRAITQGADTNRHHLMDLCGTHELCVANTFKTPKLEHRPTYREIWAPNTPGKDPGKYQTLDHVVCPRAWLPSILSTRAYAHIFNPGASHHYPVVTRIKVRLGARAQQTLRPPRLLWPKDLDQGDPVYANYNLELRKSLEEDADLSDSQVTPPSAQGSNICDTPVEEVNLELSLIHI